MTQHTADRMVLLLLLYILLLLPLTLHMLLPMLLLLPLLLVRPINAAGGLERGCNSSSGGRDTALFTWSAGICGHCEQCRTLFWCSVRLCVVCRRGSVKLGVLLVDGLGRTGTAERPVNMTKLCNAESDINYVLSLFDSGLDGPTIQVLCCPPGQRSS